MNIKLLSIILYLLIVAPLWTQTNGPGGTNSATRTVPRLVQEIGRIKRQQFAAYVAAYDPRLNKTVESEDLAKFHALEKEVFARETAGQDVRCTRLDWAYEHVKRDEPVPQEILDRFNSPEKLIAFLTPLSVSDITCKGRDNLEEFNESLAALIRWIVRDRPDYKAFHTVYS